MKSQWKWQKVTLTATQTPTAVAVTVSDDGPGVPAQDAERIFEPGFSAGPNHAGAGLGLPLARRLARGVGGDVKQARDAVFVVTLPAG